MRGVSARADTEPRAQRVVAQDAFESRGHGTRFLRDEQAAHAIADSKSAR